MTGCRTIAPHPQRMARQQSTHPSASRRIRGGRVGRDVKRSRESSCRQSIGETPSAAIKAPRKPFTIGRCKANPWPLQVISVFFDTIQASESLPISRFTLRIGAKVSNKYRNHAIFARISQGLHRGLNYLGLTPQLPAHSVSSHASIIRAAPSARHVNPGMIPDHHIELEPDHGL